MKNYPKYIPITIHFRKALILCLLITAPASCMKEPVVITELKPFSLTSPLNNAKDVEGTTTFTWNPSSGAKSYTLWISGDSSFADILFTISDIKTISYKLNTPLKDGTLFYWKVAAVHSGTSLDAENSPGSFRIKAGPVLPSPEISKYFVSPDGIDNPGRGTILNPFKTLAYAASMVPPNEGDTIFLTAGIFHETEPAIVSPGVNVIGSGESETILSSSGVKIPLTVNPSDKDFKLWYDGSLIQLTSPHYTLFRNTQSSVIAPENGNQTLSGFQIDGNNKLLKAGVWVENRNNVTMHHVIFKNIGQGGAVFAPGDKEWYTYPEFYMEGIKIHDCAFINSGKDFENTSTGNLNIGQLDGAEISNISIYDVEGYGIKFMYDGYFKNVKIHNCEINLNEYDPKWGEDIAIELWNVGPGNEIYNIICNTWLSIVNHPEMFGTPDGTENMKISNVKLIDTDGNSNKEAIEIGAPGVEVSDSYFENKGIGIAVWDMGRENITIRNNIFFNSKIKINWAGAPAIYIDNSRTWDFKSIHVYNNILDSYNIGVKIKGERILDVEIRNNVFHNLSVSDIESSVQAASFENNLKYNGSNSLWSLTGILEGSDNIIENPDFLNSGERWENFYKPLNSNSALVDNGAFVGLSFLGDAPDIGRWESY